jgi:hypothetical protein
MEFRKRLYQIQKIEITQNLKDKIESLRMDKFKKIQGGGAEEEDGLVDIDWKNIDFYKENSTQFGDFSTKFLFDKLRETYYLYLRKENRSRSAKKKGDTGTYMSWSAVELKETIEILQEILSETDEGEVGCQIESLRKSKMGHHTDCYSEEFWSDEELTKTLGGERMKIRALSMGGAIAVVFWAVVPENVREKYDGWLGPMVRNYKIQKSFISFFIILGQNAYWRDSDICGICYSILEDSNSGESCTKGKDFGFTNGVKKHSIKILLLVMGI